MRGVLYAEHRSPSGRRRINRVKLETNFSAEKPNQVVICAQAERLFCLRKRSERTGRSWRKHLLNLFEDLRGARELKCSGDNRVWRSEIEARQRTWLCKPGRGAVAWTSEAQFGLAYGFAAKFLVFPDEIF